MIELKYKFENLKICILENEDDFYFFFWKSISPLHQLFCYSINPFQNFDYFLINYILNFNLKSQGKTCAFNLMENNDVNHLSLVNICTKLDELKFELKCIIYRRYSDKIKMLSFHQGIIARSYHVCKMASFPCYLSCKFSSFYFDFEPAR